MAINPPPPSLAPADTGWSTPLQNPTPPPAVKPRPRTDVGTANDLPSVAPTKQAVAPTSPAPTPVRREILRASYQEEATPLQAVPMQTAPPAPDIATSPWRPQTRPATTPPALPNTLPLSATQQVRPLAPTEYMVAQAQGEPPANPPAKVPGKAPETMPTPRPAGPTGPFGPDQTRLPRIADIDTPLGRTPTPTAKDVEDYNAVRQATSSIRT